MIIRSILVLTDFSPAAEQAVERAAQLAVEHRATLVPMAFAAGRPPPTDAACRLAHMARELGRRLGIAVRPVSQTVNGLAHVVAQARCADLLVVADRRERSLAALLFGRLPARLARLCRCPILVSKRPAARQYRRILVAVAFSPAASKLVRLAGALDEQAEIELFHAISTLDDAKLRSAEVSFQALQAYRQACLRQARGRILKLTDSFGTRRNRVLSALGRGDPARQAAIQQQHAGADLVVVGKGSNSGLADFFFGSVAQRLLCRASSDVLVVPDDFRAATRTAAKQRLDAGPGARRGAFLASGRT